MLTILKLLFIFWDVFFKDKHESHNTYQIAPGGNHDLLLQQVYRMFFLILNFKKKSVNMPNFILYTIILLLALLNKKQNWMLKSIFYPRFHIYWF